MVFLLYIHPPCKKKNSWLRLCWSCFEDHFCSLIDLLFLCKRLIFLVLVWCYMSISCQSSWDLVCWLPCVHPGGC
ncbi:hypothetical protein ACFX13_019972 [Malus domestica]